VTSFLVFFTFRDKFEIIRSLRPDTPVSRHMGSGEAPVRRAPESGKGPGVLWISPQGAKSLDSRINKSEKGPALRRHRRDDGAFQRARRQSTAGVRRDDAETSSDGRLTGHANGADCVRAAETTAQKQRRTDKPDPTSEHQKSIR